MPRNLARLLKEEARRRRDLEQALRMSQQAQEAREALFAAFMDNSPGIASVRDEQGRLIFVNRTFQEIYGVQPEQVLGELHLPWLSEEDAARMDAHNRQVLAENRPRRFEERTTDLEGRCRIWLSVRFPFQLPSGKRYLGAISLDITERKQQEEALRDSESELKRLQRLQRHEFELMVRSVSEYAIYMLDPQGRVMTWNDGAEAITGYHASEALGRPNTLFFTPEDLEAGTPEHLLDRALAEGSVEDDGWRVRKSGERFCAHTALTAVRDQGRLLGFVKVVRDMTEPYRLEAIQRELAALAKLDRMKDDFLSVISHELRTPLNFIMGFASILDDEAAGPLTPLQHEYLDKILHGANRLLFHVNNLVEMSRLSAGMLHLQPSPTEYESVIAQVLETFRPLADDKRIRLEADVQVKGEILVDGQRLTQVIGNLVDNAIKFTPDDGRVTVTARAEEAMLITEVRDTGIGLAAEAIPKIFERFVQLDMTSTRTVGGTGLGLAISKSIVEAHGGRIGVRSEGPGKGSTFWFSLPLAREGAET